MNCCKCDKKAYVNYKDKKPTNDKDLKSIVNYSKLVRLIKKLTKNN